MIQLKQPLEAALREAKQRARARAKERNRIDKERSRIYHVENPSVDNFDELLKQSGCVDVAGLLPRWKRRCFDEGRGYSSIRRYQIRDIDTRQSFSTKMLLDHIGCKIYVNQATVREILSFTICHRKRVQKLLEQGKILVALGRDDFSFFSEVAMTFCLKKGALILGEVSLSRARWTSRHVLLLRANRS